MITRKLLSHCAGCVLLVYLTGCTTVDPRADYDRVARHVAAATGQPALYSLADESVIAARVAELLHDGLTADEAAQVALLNNPRLQAELLTIGVSRAEVVQSALLTNPTLSLSLRWPDSGGLSNLEIGLAQNLAELWQIPFRKRAAEREFERVILEVARTVSVAALEAQTAYYKALRADRERDLARENVSLSAQVVDVAVARRDAGSGSEVDVNLARSQHLETQLKQRQAQLAAIEARADLARRLGLRTPPAALALVDELPSAEPRELVADKVIARAREQRLDFRAVARSVEAARSRVALEKSRFLRALEVGVSVERSERGRRGDRNWLAETAWASVEAGQPALPALEPREPLSTDWVAGPTLSLELPLFDQNQAQIAKAEYEYQQAARALEALDRELVQEVYVACERARTAADNAGFLQRDYLPLQEQSLTLAREAYRSGRTTLLAVLDAQRSLLAARVGYLDALLNAALATLELERAAGQPAAGLLDTVATTQPGSTEAHPRPEDQP